MKQYYIIKKGRGYWKRGDIGYTDTHRGARVFTEQEANEIVNQPNSDKLKEQRICPLCKSGNLRKSGMCDECPPISKNYGRDHEADWEDAMENGNEWFF